LTGGLVGLVLLKFSNPPIMERWVTAPTNVYEFALNTPWPIAWGYVVFSAVALFAFLRARPCLGRTSRLAGLPAAWLLWQLAASFRTIDPQSTWPTVIHFTFVCASFYLGYFALNRLLDAAVFWWVVLAGFALVLAAGWNQHFGGIERTRQFFYTYMLPQMTEIPPDYLKKIASNRIFGTLFYPNALAGAVLLLLPGLLVALWRMERALTAAARAFVIAVVTCAALACLYWSGSKGGWLLAMLVVVIVLFQLRWPKGLKILVAVVLVTVGLAGFFWKYAAFFQKGATSVGARMDYWRAALSTAAAHPVVGTGPGTFRLAYEAVRLPGSEPARLVHNDYLEQASGSGLPGFLLYSAFIVGVLLKTWPPPGTSCSRSANQAGDSPMNPDPRVRQWHVFAVWLGVLGWCLQGLFEFGLFLPALSWPAFLFLGWLLRQAESCPAGVAPPGQPAAVGSTNCRSSV
jgi:O-antigen ligase